MYRRPDKEPLVYILASRPNGTLYIGVTSNIYERMCQHRDGSFGGFTAKYNVKQLVYFEVHESMDSAIQRESRLKKWHRLWKIRLIEQIIPTWSDLFDPAEGVKQMGQSGQAFRDWSEDEDDNASSLGWPPSRP